MKATNTWAIVIAPSAPTEYMDKGAPANGVFATLKPGDCNAGILCLAVRHLPPDIWMLTGDPGTVLTSIDLN